MDVSIIVRCFNSERTIARALRSASSQKYSGAYEIIVVDDGSMDGSIEIVTEHVRRDPRVQLVRQQHGGAIRAANTGFRAATGTYVCLLDSDDEYEPVFLSVMSRALNRTNMDHAYCDYREEIDGKTRIVQVGDVWKTIAINILIRRDRLLEASMFREDVLLFPEYDLLLRTLGSWQGVHVQETLVTYHRRRESLTGDMDHVDTALEQLKTLHPDRMEEIGRIRSYLI